MSTGIDLCPGAVVSGAMPKPFFLAAQVFGDSGFTALYTIEYESSSIPRRLAAKSRQERTRTCPSAAESEKVFCHSNLRRG